MAAKKPKKRRGNPSWGKPSRHYKILDEAGDTRPKKKKPKKQAKKKKSPRNQVNSSFG